MDKVITVCGKEVGFRATALTPRLYRHKIGRDIVRDMNRLLENYKKAVRAKNLEKPGDGATDEQKAAYEEALKDAQLSVMDLETFEDVAYIMARQYDPENTPDTPDEWLNGFAFFSIYEILPHIVELWNMNQTTTSSPKKK